MEHAIEADGAAYDGAAEVDPSEIGAKPLLVIKKPSVVVTSAVVAEEISPLLTHRSPSWNASPSPWASTLHDPILLKGPLVGEGDMTAERVTWRRTASVYWLIPPFTIYCLAMGAVSVPKLNVILNLICYQHHLADDNNSDVSRSAPPGADGTNPACQTAEVHSLLANFMLYAHLISGALCAITSPRLGKLSDRYGRCYILAFSAMGMLLGDVITLTAATFPDTVSVYWILLEFAFGGLAGAFIATMAVIQSYAADCTLPERRSTAFSYLHGCMYFGIAIGPVLGGAIIKAAGDNILVIFYAAFACHACFILSVLFVIPESLSQERQASARARYAMDRAESASDRTKSSKWNPLPRMLAFFRPLEILRPSSGESDSTTRKNLLLLSGCDTVVFGVTLGSASIVVMYSEYSFHWGTFESSVFVSIANSCRVAMLLVALPLAFRAYRWYTAQNPITVGDGKSSSLSEHFDIPTIRAAVFFDVLGYLGYALAPTGPLFIAAGVVASVGGIASPTLQSALTTHVSPERTGELMGAVSLLHALSRIVAPAVLHLVYGRTVRKLSSAVFWCLVTTFAGAWAATWGIRPRTSKGVGMGGYLPVELSDD